MLINRQPSLHKFSLLAAFSEINFAKTITLNPFICKPFNADFDGDEMNIHTIQEIQSNTEAKNILLPDSNKRSTNSNKFLITLIQVYLNVIGLYLKSLSIFYKI